MADVSDVPRSAADAHTTNAAAAMSHSTRLVILIAGNPLLREVCCGRVGSRSGLELVPQFCKRLLDRMHDRQDVILIVVAERREAEDLALQVILAAGDYHAV